MPRTHYVSWGSACEILSDLIFQSPSLDIKPKKGFRRAVTHKYSSVFLVRQNLKKSSGITTEIYLEAECKLDVSGKGSLPKIQGNRSRSRKRNACQVKHLYWISQVITRACTNKGRDGKPDPAIECPKSSALLEDYLFLRKTFPDLEDFSIPKKRTRTILECRPRNAYW